MKLISTFYQVTKNDYSDGSVYKAIKKCDAELRNYVDLNDIDKFYQFFFDEDETGHLKPNKNNSNLLDFYDLIVEFEENIMGMINESDNLQIFSAIMIVKDMNNNNTLDDIRESLSEQESKRFDMLLEFIFTIPECDSVSTTYKQGDEIKAQSYTLDMRLFELTNLAGYLRKNMEVALALAFINTGLVEISSFAKNDNRFLKQFVLIKNRKWIFAFKGKDMI